MRATEFCDLFYVKHDDMEQALSHFPEYKRPFRRLAELRYQMCMPKPFEHDGFSDKLPPDEFVDENLVTRFAMDFLRQRSSGSVPASGTGYSPDRAKSQSGRRGSTASQLRPVELASDTNLAEEMASLKQDLSALREEMEALRPLLQ